MRPFDVTSADLRVVRPDGQLARILGYHLRTRLRESVVAIIVSAETGLSLPSHRAERYAILDPRRHYSPGLYVGHYKLLDAVCRQDGTAVKSTLNSLDRLSDQDWYANGLTISTVRRQDWEPSVATRLAEHPAPDRYGRMTSIGPASSTELDRARPAIHDALQLMESADPDMAEEVKEHVRQLLLWQGTGLRGATSLQFFGAIFLRLPYPDYDPLLFFFEHLVHETLHLQLNIVQTMDSLVLNAVDERYVSPLRPDPRPMIGIFHAQFVLARLIYMINKSMPLVSHRKTFAVRSDVLRERFNQGFAVISKYANFTGLGQQIFDDLRELCE